jgi:hypothetical protein
LLQDLQFAWLVDATHGALLVVRKLAFNLLAHVESLSTLLLGSEEGAQEALVFLRTPLVPFVLGRWCLNDPSGVDLSILIGVFY